ncbi:hypothetical protein SAMN05216191_11169 [Paenibacillus jilunlii]|uniref:Uncharacterized protein n=1 Tax=Paenibacillus jilunlii TaxID=682956 RepID=A0A1G9S6E9_9BACL|nr:hypothetical protein SAMN05216191_11169 [Paenibacillus jilunlii]
MCDYYAVGVKSDPGSEWNNGLFADNHISSEVYPTQSNEGCPEPAHGCRDNPHFYYLGYYDFPFL